MNIPDWVPSAVADEARLISGEGVDERATEILHRITTDERMQPVWRELLKRKPTSDADTTLRVLFRSFFTSATDDYRIPTAAEIKALIESYREQAVRLRAEIAQIRKRDGDYAASEARHHTDALERAAAWCDEQAGFPDVPPPPTIQRYYGHGRESSLAVALAAAMRDAYGLEMRGTVARMITVATDTKVTSAQVRDWIARVEG